MRLSRQFAAGDIAMSIRHVNSVVLLLAGMLFLGGCGAKTATFPGKDAKQVWSAMVTVAEDPVYPDWRVVENEVWTNRDTASIEIYRVIRRDRVEPGNTPQRETETWKFQIVMTSDQPPTLKFLARQMVVPAHAWVQAEQYFADVETLLEEVQFPGGEVEESPAVVELEFEEVIEIDPAEG
jgi:hypothetical protein